MSSPGRLRSYRLSGTGGSRALSLASPIAATLRCTRDFERPSSEAIGACVKRSRRSASMAAFHSGGKALGLFKGRDERSFKPELPSCTKRRVHLRVVLLLVPNCSPTTSAEIPLMQRAAMISRLTVVVRAKLWMFTCASGVVWVFGDFQNTPQNASGQLCVECASLSVSTRNDVLGHHT